MQLNYKLSLACASILCTMSLEAQDYVRVNLMQYNETNNRVKVIAPAIEVNKDFGVDYTLKATLVSDSVSGATPIYSDTSSGASAFSRGVVTNTNDIKKQNVSFSERRMLYALAFTNRFKNRDELSSSYTKSYESDYDANTLSFDYLHWADSSKNLSYDIGVSYSLNNILVRGDDTSSGASKKESSNTIATQIGFTQIINKTSLFKADLFYSKEDGYLTNPYYNIVRDTNNVVVENRPDIRTSYGFNLKYIKAFKDNLTSKFKYKFYTDDWDITSHTIDINNYYKINEKFIIGLGIRYYKQSQANFYNSDINYFTNEKYASIDDRLSAFNSTTYKSSLDYKYNKKISYDISYSLYKQSTNLNASTITLGIKYKF